MRKNRSKKSKSSNNNNLYSEAFPPDKNGYRPKIISYSPTHDILKEQGQEDIIKIIDPSKIIYKPLNEIIISKKFLLINIIHIFQ